MKYVSPIYEVETIETEDIMSESPLTLANKYGIGVSGTTVNTKGESTVTSVTLTTTNDKGEQVETTDKTQATGVSIGINFGALFG
jgi:hypothetical protein